MKNRSDGNYSYFADDDGNEYAVKEGEVQGFLKDQVASGKTARPMVRMRKNGIMGRIGDALTNSTGEDDEWVAPNRVEQMKGTGDWDQVDEAGTPSVWELALNPKTYTDHYSKAESWKELPANVANSFVGMGDAALVGVGKGAADLTLATGAAIADIIPTKTTHTWAFKMREAMKTVDDFASNVLDETNETWLKGLYTQGGVEVDGMKDVTRSALDVGETIGGLYGMGKVIGAGAKGLSLLPKVTPKVAGGAAGALMFGAQGAEGTLGQLEELQKNGEKISDAQKISAALTSGLINGAAGILLSKFAKILPQNEAAASVKMSMPSVMKTIMKDMGHSAGFMAIAGTSEDATRGIIGEEVTIGDVLKHAITNAVVGAGLGLATNGAKMVRPRAAMRQLYASSRSMQAVSALRSAAEGTPITSNKTLHPDVLAVTQNGRVVFRDQSVFIPGDGKRADRIVLTDGTTLNKDGRVISVTANVQKEWHGDGKLTPAEAMYRMTDADWMKSVRIIDPETGDSVALEEIQALGAPKSYTDHVNWNFSGRKGSEPKLDAEGMAYAYLFSHASGSPTASSRAALLALEQVKSGAMTYVEAADRLNRALTATIGYDPYSPSMKAMASKDSAGLMDLKEVKIAGEVNGESVEGRELTDRAETLVRWAKDGTIEPDSIDASKISDFNLAVDNRAEDKSGTVIVRKTGDKYEVVTGSKAVADAKAKGAKTVEAVVVHEEDGWDYNRASIIAVVDAVKEGEMDMAEAVRAMRKLHLTDEDLAGIEAKDLETLKTANKIADNVDETLVNNITDENVTQIAAYAEHINVHTVGSEWEKVQRELFYQMSDVVSEGEIEIAGHIKANVPEMDVARTWELARFVAENIERGEVYDRLNEGEKGIKALEKMMSEDEIAQFPVEKEPGKLVTVTDAAKTTKLEAKSGLLEGVAKEDKAFKFEAVEGKDAWRTARFPEVEISIAMTEGENPTKVLNVTGLDAKMMLDSKNRLDVGKLLKETTARAEEMGIKEINLGDEQLAEIAEELVKNYGDVTRSRAYERRTKTVMDLLSKSGLADKIVTDPKEFEAELAKYPEGEQFIKDGKTYGFYANGKVFLNASYFGTRIGLNTTIHEFAHPAVSMLRKVNQEMYARGIELVKKTQYFEDLTSHADYSKKSEAHRAEEALVRLIADRASELETKVPKSILEEIKDFIRKFWQEFGEKVFGVGDLTPEMVEKMTLEDIADAVRSEMMSGKEFGGKKLSAAEGDLKVKIDRFAKYKNPASADAIAAYKDVQKAWKELGSEAKEKLASYGEGETKRAERYRGVIEKLVEWDQRRAQASERMKKQIRKAPNKAQRDILRSSPQWYFSNVADDPTTPYAFIVDGNHIAIPRKGDYGWDTWSQLTDGMDKESRRQMARLLGGFKYKHVGEPGAPNNDKIVREFNEWRAGGLEDFNGQINETETDFDEFIGEVLKGRDEFLKWRADGMKSREEIEAERDEAMAMEDEGYREFRKEVERLRAEGAELTPEQIAEIPFARAAKKPVTPVDKSYREAFTKKDAETGKKLTEEAAKMAGYTIHAYHGTGRADRVGNKFDPKRATSGPMAFFTSSKTIAEGYARDKQDTSLSYESEDVFDYKNQFKAKKGSKEYNVYDLWWYLPFEKRQEITKRAAHVTEDYNKDGAPIVYDENNTDGLGAYDMFVKNNRGNVIKALHEMWLDGGNLFNNEGKYLEVLKEAGISDAIKSIGLSEPTYKDPYARHEKVYDVYLKMTNPFYTANIDENFTTGLLEWWSKQNKRKYKKTSQSADHWDKNDKSVEEFAQDVERDLAYSKEHGVNHYTAWTSIPDAISDYLRSQGYDGIIDSGNKFKSHNDDHNVYIPFKSSQIKSAEPFVTNNSGKLIPLSERFNEEKTDIRFNRGDRSMFVGGKVRVAEDEGRGEMTKGAIAASRELSLDDAARSNMAIYGGVNRKISLPISDLNWLRKELTGKQSGLKLAADTFGMVDKSDLKYQKDFLKANGYFQNEDMNFAMTHTPAELRAERLRSEKQLTWQLEAVFNKRLEMKEGGQEAARSVFADQVAEEIMNLKSVPAVGKIREIRTVGDAVKAALVEKVGADESIRGEADRFLTWAYGEVKEGETPIKDRAPDELVKRMFSAFLVMPETMSESAPNWADAIEETIAADKRLRDAYQKIQKRDTLAQVESEITRSLDRMTERTILEMKAASKEPIVPAGRLARAKENFLVAFDDKMAPVAIRVDEKKKLYIEAKKKALEGVKDPKVRAMVEEEIAKFTGLLESKMAKLEMSRLAFERGSYGESRAYLMRELNLINEMTQQHGLTIDDMAIYLDMKRGIETQGRANSFGMSVKQNQMILDKMEKRLGPAKWGAMQRFAGMWTGIHQQEFLAMPELKNAIGDKKLAYFESQTSYATTKRTLAADEAKAIEAEMKKAGVKKGDLFDQAITYFGSTAPGEGLLDKKLVGSFAAKENMLSATFEKIDRTQQFLRRNQYIIDLKNALLAAKVDGVEDVGRSNAKFGRADKYGTLNYLENGSKRTLIVPKQIAEAFSHDPGTVSFGQQLHSLWRSAIIDYNPAYWNRNIARNQGSFEKNMPGTKETVIQTALRPFGLSNTVATVMQHLVRHAPATARLFDKDTIYAHLPKAKRLATILQDPNAYQRKIFAAEASGDTEALAYLTQEFNEALKILKTNALVPLHTANKGTNANFLDDVFSKKNLKTMEEAAKELANKSIFDKAKDAATYIFRRNKAQQEFEDNLVKIAAILHDQMKYGHERTLKESARLAAENVGIGQGERSGKAKGLIQATVSSFFNMVEKGVKRNAKAHLERPGEMAVKDMKVWGGRFLGGLITTGVAAAVWKKFHCNDDEEIAKNDPTYRFLEFYRKAHKNFSNYVRDNFNVMPLWTSADGKYSITLGMPYNDEDKLIVPTAQAAAEIVAAKMGLPEDPKLGEAIIRQTVKAVTPDLALSAPMWTLLRDTVETMWHNPDDFYTGGKIYDQNLYDARFASLEMFGKFNLEVVKRLWNDLGGRAFLQFDRNGVEGPAKEGEFLDVVFNRLPVASPLVRSFIKIQTGDLDKYSKVLDANERERLAVLRVLRKEIAGKSTAESAWFVKDQAGFQKWIDEKTKTYGLTFDEVFELRANAVKDWLDMGPNGQVKDAKKLPKIIERSLKSGMDPRKIIN